MDEFSSGVAQAPEQPPGTVGPDSVSDDRVSEAQGVSRRHAFTGGAAILAAATTMVAGGAGTAVASTRDRSAAAKNRSSKARRIYVNGRNRIVTSSPDTMLLYVLRDEFHLRGPKFGCGLSECGACAVLQDGKQIRSCVTPLSTVGSKKIITLDGLAASYHRKSKAKKGALHPLQQAWIDEQVPQCGYCQSGMIIQAADLLSTNPHPTDAEIKKAMNGHLCRCGTYNGIRRAIKRAAKEMAK
jgi:isoquinoline 1-oxidoreductase subunit alpha